MEASPSRGKPGEQPPVWRWHAEPESAGLRREALLEAAQALEAGREAGQHAGAQLYVSRHGQAVLEFACGDALTGAPLEPDSIMAWFSSGKPLTAVAIAWLHERKKLDLDDAVARYLPEFGNGKERCTIRHLLTHQGGFPNGLRDSAHKTWEQKIAAIERMRERQAAIRRGRRR